MEINPKLNLDAFEASFHAIDTHTVGEFTRIITSGFPKLEGDTMIERKNFLAKHYDKYRQALMFEPRGHHDMFGALLTDPIHPEADFGVECLYVSFIKGVCFFAYPHSFVYFYTRVYEQSTKVVFLVHISERSSSLQ